MSIMSEVALLVETVAPCYTGYAPTGAKLPYVAHRPLLVSPEELALAGDALGWDYQTTLYCCAGSSEASLNLAVLVMQALHGARVAGTTVSCSMGYAGALLEGQYESQITVQLNQGGLA